MDESAPLYTHFGTTEADLPAGYYTSIGRALYRWSQLESTVGLLAASLFKMPWLDAMQRLRGGKGFNTTGNFELLISQAQKRKANDRTLKAIEHAQKLFELRKVLFHSVWGHLTGNGVTAVGIQEWSNTSYDNFRTVSLAELDAFAAECREVWIEFLNEVLPHFHDAKAIAIDDANGLVRGV